MKIASAEEVAAALAPLTVGKVKSDPPPPHDWVETAPEALTVRQSPAPEPSAEIVRLVVEARPVFDIEKRVVVALCVEEPMAKRVVLVDPLLACTDSAPHGEEEATPMVPAVASANAVEVAGRLPKRSPPMLSRFVAVEEVANE